MLTEIPIVLIDDEPTIVDVLSRVLATRAGFRVHGFTDSAAALQWLSQHTPALVITDHLMPGPSGLDVARMLRNQPRTQDVPILMLAGAIDATLREEVRNAGVDRLADKPLRMADLLDYVDELLRDSGLTQLL